MNLSEILTAIGVLVTAVSVAVALGVYLHAVHRQNEAKIRRAAAFKSLLSRECELNLWTIKQFEDFSRAMAASQENPRLKVSVETNWKGRRPAFKQEDDDGAALMAVPEVHRATMASVILELATDHRELFELVQPCLDALAELENVRAQLISAPEHTELGEQNFLHGLADYASRRCDEARDSLDVLYQFCAGKPLTTFRLR